MQICKSTTSLDIIIKTGFDTLEARREQLTEQLTERFFRRSVLPETLCLLYLLPSKRDVSVTSRLRHARTLELLKCRTVKFSTFFDTLLFGPLCLGYISQLVDTVVGYFCIIFSSFAI